MKVLLVKPPLEVNANPYSLRRIACGLPLGLLYVAASLERDGHDVSVFDAIAEFDAETLHKTLQNAETDDVSFSRVHFGASWDAIAARIRLLKPDVVGISNQFSDSTPSVVRLANLVKSIDLGIFVMVGGNHATANPGDFLRDGVGVDVVVRGEGEVTARELLARLAGGLSWHDVSGVAFRRDGEVVSSQFASIRDLDALPLPAYHLIDLENYFLLERLGYGGRAGACRQDHRVVSVVTSRGCPFNCVFCSIKVHMGRQWRPHSAGVVLDHLELLVTKFGVRHIDFEDDNLTLNPDRFEAILDGILDRKLDFTWGTSNGVRADRLSEKLLRKAKQAGCRMLAIGVESGNQRILDQVVCKSLKLPKVREIAMLCHRISIDAYAFFVIGMPGETKENIRETISLAAELTEKWGMICFVFVARPMPGTRLREICEEGGYLTDPVDAKAYRFAQRLNIHRTEMIATSEFSLEDIDALFAESERTLLEARRRFVKSYVLSHPALLWRAAPSAIRLGWKRPASLMLSFKEQVWHQYDRHWRKLYCAEVCSDC